MDFVTETFAFSNRSNMQFATEFLTKSGRLEFRWSKLTFWPIGYKLWPTFTTAEQSVGKKIWPKFWPSDTPSKEIATDFATQKVSQKKFSPTFLPRCFGHKYIFTDFCNWNSDQVNNFDRLWDRIVSRKKSMCGTLKTSCIKTLIILHKPKFHLWLFNFSDTFLGYMN